MSARSNKTSTPSSLLSDSTSKERAIARADSAVWVVNKDREPEAIGYSGRGHSDCVLNGHDEASLVLYVEPLSDARAPLADFF